MIKSAIQRVISCLPMSYRWNEMFQRLVTKGLDLNETNFLAKLHCCRTHLECYRRFSTRSKEDFSVLELGTGWFPIVPIGMYLCGASAIRTYDIVPLLRADTFQCVVQWFCDFERQQRLREILPWIRPERVDWLRKYSSLTSAEKVPDTFLKTLNIDVRVEDARHTALPDASIDLVFSTFVLEHISWEVLVDLFKEFKRVSAAGAVASHYVGLADQYASFDRSITPFNFLQYTSSQWAFFNNPIIPLNRFRISDYRRLFRETGYALVDETNTLGKAEELSQITLAPEFQRYSMEELLVLYSWLVARPS